MDWQPIDTAPRDGTQIILFLARRHDRETDHIMVAGFVDDDFRVIAGIRDKDMHFFTTLWMPWTHWMPLPSPPEEIESGANAAADNPALAKSSHEEAAQGDGND